MNKKDCFDRICGDCAGVDISTLTDDDIIDQAQVWAESGEPVSNDEINAAIQYLVDERQ
ncbi:MAG: hypothetical protein PHG14_15705 [Desulfobacter postgatei]|uniref:hypothetical protein n=1 Tax=Desulfobacter postgatei TaxID=2293 RepID=UPI0023EF84AF|nr:hypothetical protein [Desulfobacter postgatei]MDD4275161.1 hypothetical protein [Desulfobacter postgatei]